MEITINVRQRKKASKESEGQKAVTGSFGCGVAVRGAHMSVEDCDLVNLKRVFSSLSCHLRVQKVELKLRILTGMWGWQTSRVDFCSGICVCAGMMLRTT